MTRDRDIERVLDRFYAEGPSEMPDRVLLSVFDRIERVPQRRLALQMTRFATMNRNLRLALAAAIVVAVVGVGAFAWSRMSNVAAPPTPSPSLDASPTSGVAGSALPVALQGRWVGAPRVVPEAPEPPYRNALLLSDLQFGFALAGQGQAQQFASIASLVAPDQLSLRGASTDGGCQPRDEGTYSFSLDASGTTLTLTPIADACGPRAAAAAGAWTRVGCTDSQGWCLGDVPPGTHKSTIFTPLVAPATWQFDYGRFSYTVPAGWTNREDCAGCYVLAKQGAPDTDGLYLFSDIVAHADYGTACQDDIAAGVGRSANAIANYLTTRPGLAATVPTPISIDGLSGVTFDISVAPTWTATCSFSNGLPVVATFTDSDPATGGFDWNVGGTTHDRVILLDMPDGRALLIDVEAATAAEFDSLAAEALPVIETFAFRR